MPKNERSVCVIIIRYFSRIVIKLSWLLVGLLTFAGCQSAFALETENILTKLESMTEASLMVVDSKGRMIHSIRADIPRIPASTLKLLTTLLVIEKWGLSHRFYTDFFRVNQDDLWIKGYGDPYLISEELDLIIDQLEHKGIHSFKTLGIDRKRFPDTLQLDGRSDSRNPYDAPLGALAANFNTIAVNKFNNSVQTGELQTPLTPMAISLSRALIPGRHRINIPSMSKGGRYFAELFAEKSKQRGISFDNTIIQGRLPRNTTRIFRHYNSRNLAAILKGMLRYSNNFIANQLYLLLGTNAEEPVSLERSSKFVARQIDKTFSWKHYRILEGAGLSRKNRLNARQIVDVLERLTPYRSLLPKQNSRIFAKTGTLRGVSCYAGYLRLDSGWASFVLLINQQVPYRFRFKVAEALLSSYSTRQ